MPIALPTFRRHRVLFTTAILALVLGGVGLSRLAIADDNTGYPAASLTAPTDPAALIARGKYLVAAADCMPCHSGPNHAPYSGGLVLNTPFGGLASPNITPDKTTGIGNWTDKQFYDAIHYGEAPGRSYVVFPNYIYPAMPFTSYTKLSYADVMAIKAYLFSLAPVHVAPTPNTLAFPFNQRPVLLGWRILFFHEGPMKINPSWSPAMVNGAYLTEALGHCGECHTPRNIMSGLELSRAYAGAPIDSYYAPNISSDKNYGVGGWSSSDLTDYLYKDGNMHKGSAFGPMAEVVKYSLSQLPPSDVQDIADYLQTQTKPQDTAPLPAVADAARSVALGATVYAANCQGCHGKTGGGLGTIIPNLAGNDAVMASVPTNIIGAVLNGLAPWRVGPAMPSFAASLSDEQIAGVANYVRTAWGNNALPDASPKDVMALRAIAVVPPMASQAADLFGCPHVSGAGGPTSVADPGSNMLDIYEGATPETMPNRTRALISAIRTANSSISNADLTNDLVAAYCPVVANEAGLTHAEKQAALDTFITSTEPLVDGPVASN
ncbi:MAG: cytochrome c [Acidocella sp.]|nr:cytochrome c [Acidocella sp.]